MKKISNSILFVLLAVLLFMGCKKDDDNESYFRVGEDKYTLSHGYIEYMGKGADMYVYAFDLLSSGMTMDEQGNWHKSGTGLWIQLRCSAEGGISTGTYEFSDDLSPFTIATITYNPAWSEKVVNNMVLLKDGTIYVEKKGNNYSILLLGTDIYGKSIRADFSGNLDIYDVSITK